MSIKEEIFDVLRRNLVATFPFYASKEVVLCPVCFTEITKDEVLRGALEHIIPQNVVGGDPESLRIFSKNQRCGITVLCRQRRIWGNDITYTLGERSLHAQIKWSDKLAEQGCNGLKGSLYDRLFRGLLDDKPHDSNKLTTRHRVAILMMGYLGAFQRFGYEYALLPWLNEVRDQFDHPDVKITNWLDRVVYFGDMSNPGICSTEDGLPFMVSQTLHEEAPLVVYFRRFRVELPSGHLLVNKHPESLQTLLHKK